MADGMENRPTAARLIVEALEQNGVERIFCVPGESYLALLDALHDSRIAVTLCRQEGGAAMAAEAWGKLTGRPGILMVTRGPGATNASAGIHVGRQDSTPMIVFIGQVGRAMRGREAFQEIDFRRMFGQMAKWIEEIDDADRAAEAVSRAFYEATSGRPGPVVLSLPEDVLRQTSGAANPRPWVQVETHPGLTQMAELQKMLWRAKQPFVIAGGSRWSEAAVAALQRFAERFALPVGCSWRRQGLFDNEHPNYAGDIGVGINPALAARVREADLLLLIGGRMSEMPSSAYTLIDIPEPAPDAGPCPSGRRGARPPLPADAGHQCQPDRLRRGAGRPAAAERRSRGAAAPKPPTRTTAPGRRRSTNPGPVQLSRIVAWLRERLPDDAVIASAAGNYSVWVHRFFRHRRFGTQLAPGSGSMGYGLPAGLAAKLKYPERMVVVFAGDGDFQMTMQEFVAAVQAGAAIVVVVVNNGIHGTIRMHQERPIPAAPSPPTSTIRISPPLPAPAAAMARRWQGRKISPPPSSAAWLRPSRRSSTLPSTRKRSPRRARFPRSAAPAGDSRAV